MRRFMALTGAGMRIGCLLLGFASSAFGQPDPIDARGNVPQQGSLSFFPWETINTYGGNVLLSFLAIVLPGNAGFNLVVQRSYNSKDTNWTFAVGPNVFFPPDDSYGYPVVLMPDGGEIATLKTSEAGTYISTSFMRVKHRDPDVHLLEMPNGVVCHYHPDGRLESMNDPFGNTIEIDYVGESCLIDTVRQHLGNDQTREVVFTYDDDGKERFITYDAGDQTQRRWEYRWQAVPPSNSFWQLTEAIPPAGPSWTFAYSGDTMQWNPCPGALSTSMRLWA
jgi:hypothetical protein